MLSRSNEDAVSFSASESAPVSRSFSPAFSPNFSAYFSISTAADPPRAAPSHAPSAPPNGPATAAPNPAAATRIAGFIQESEGRGIIVTSDVASVDRIYLTYYSRAAITPFIPAKRNLSRYSKPDHSVGHDSARRATNSE